MVKRRKMLIGMGALAAGGAGAVGTGALTAGRSDRSFNVEVAHDSGAYLGLEKTGSNNASEHVSYTSSGELEIDIGSTGAGGSGVAPDSAAAFDDLFLVKNQGTSTIYVAMDEYSNNVNIVFYVQINGKRHKVVGGASVVGSPPQAQYVNGNRGGYRANAIKISTGDSVTMGLEAQAPTSVPNEVKFLAADNQSDLEDQWSTDFSANGVDVIDTT